MMPFSSARGAICIVCLGVALGVAPGTAWASDPAPPPSSREGEAIALPPSHVGAPGTLTAAPTSPAPTPSSHRLSWDPQWHRFRVVEYVSTALTAVASVGVFEFTSPSDHPKWVGPILFDSVVRNTFRLRTRGGITAAADLSNVVAYVVPIQSLVDSLVLPTIDRNLDVAWQLGLMDAEAFALSGLVTSSLYTTTGRARPSYADCKAGTSPSPYCYAGPYASFPSGHTTVAMTGAGLICAHHEELPLYGSHVLDVAACVEGLTIAAGVGTLRIMADRHYSTDVLTGGAIGFFSGYALPKLLHYWRRPPGEIVNRGDVKVALTLGSGVTPLGAQAVGVF